MRQPQRIANGGFDAHLTRDRIADAFDEPRIDGGQNFLRNFEIDHRSSPVTAVTSCLLDALAARLVEPATYSSESGAEDTTTLPSRRIDCNGESWRRPRLFPHLNALPLAELMVFVTDFFHALQQRICPFDIFLTSRFHL